MDDYRIGQGYDVHPFGPGRPLVLGGIEIPCNLGLAGHSDADVLTHAICDAVLGAAGLGDIGQHFPDTDEQYRGIRSVLLLERVVASVAEKGWRVVNVDATVIAERPKLAPHVGAMAETLREALAPSGRGGSVNIKATTTEGLGFVGRVEGVAAQAIALLTRLEG